MGFRVLPKAESDIEAITAGIASESPSAAGRWLDNVYRRFMNLGDMPGIGPERPEIGAGVRLFPLGQYVVLYRQDGDGVDIVRVLHGKRDPETWL